MEFEANAAEIGSQHEELEVNTEVGNPSTVESLCTSYRNAYDEVEALTEQLKQANATKTAAGEALYDFLVAEGLETVKTAEGSFSPDKVEEVSIDKANEDAAFSWLEGIGLGGIIKRTVHFQTLNKAYRDGELQVSSENESMFKTWTRKRIRIRRKK